VRPRPTLLALFAVGASAQSVLSTAVERTSDGGSRTTITFAGPPSINGLAEVVRGAPYSAEQTRVRTQTLADGTKIVETSPIVQMFRDSAGRRRIDSNQKDVELAEIRDFVANVEYTLDVANHVPHRMNFILDGTPRVAERKSSQRSSLGTRIIEALLCDGTLEKTTIPAGAEGNGKEIVTTVETWISRNLKIRVESTARDPRIGETVTKMTHIRLEEPAAALFQVSPDYRIQDETGRFSIDVIRRFFENERPVRALIKAFADARNAHDGAAAAATYASEGEYRAFDRPPVKGSVQLSEMWGRMTGQMSRRVNSVQFVAPNLAVVLAEERFVGPEGENQAKEVYTVARIDGEWKILVHQQ
jgi:uncharacterized protein (TIGR02246 family)